ncbi:hypothetical protein FACS189472_12250 [Alphaproteobacteria bacterium]|nr:hypothetical protein FACS189472_12250 [Alphaproteobacteria bacterium]
MIGLIEYATESFWREQVDLHVGEDVEEDNGCVALQQGEQRVVAGILLRRGKEARIVNWIYMHIAV